MSAQVPIKFQNPSFENVSRAEYTLGDWISCGMPGETPPDIQPGMFGYTVAPAEGRSYLGMVTRDNHTWESVSRKLFYVYETSKVS